MTLSTLRPPRLIGWLIAAVLLTTLVWWVAPQQLPVTAYKASLVAAAGVLGYWLDRSLFPYARPDDLLEALGPSTLVLAAAMLRRALIVAAAMLAMGLGA